MLNWLARYAPAVRALEDAGPFGSVLDVGCGVHGLSCVRPDVPFVGVDVLFGAPVVPSMVGFKIEPGPLPWPDNAFDTVICLDSLEHIPQPERRGFVAELGRVAAQRLFIACPSSAAQPFDDLVRDRYKMPDGSPPPWLVEHYAEGLPSPEEIAAAVAAVPGMAVREVAMPDGLLCALMLIADLDPGFSTQSFTEAAALPGEWSRVLDEARFGPGFRPAYLLERTTPVRAVVDAADLEASATAALTDPGAVQRVPNMAPPAPPAVAAPAGVRDQPLATDKGLRLWLQPDWADPLSWVPPLAAYMRTAVPEGDVVLCLDGEDPTLQAGQVEALVAMACEQIAGDRPFAEVLLMGTDVVREGLERVRDAADVRRLLGAGAPEDSGSDVDRLWAQVLLDALRRQTDGWRHEAAPPLEPSVDPVLSVVVVGAGADAGALEATVASVRALERPRVELLVVSADDGGDGVGGARLVRAEPGAATAMQLDAGLAAATGDWLLAVEAGDRLVAAGVWELLRLATWMRRDVVVGASVDPTADVPAALATVALVSRRLAHVGGDPASPQPPLLARLQRLLGLGVPVERTPQLVLVHGAPAPSPAPEATAELLADVVAL